MNWYKQSQKNSIRLWLDDERDPSTPIIQQKFLANGDEIWVKTVAEAKNMIQKGNVSFISFDHDLGQEETGYDLARWIEERAFVEGIQPPDYRVHSANPVGAKNIDQAMQNAFKYWNRK